MHKDPVTPELWREIYLRDGMACMAPRLDPGAGPCRGKWGPVRFRRNGQTFPDDLTVDHVKDQPMMGKRAPSDARHLVLLCWGHHVWGSWATSNRPLLREYLKEINRGQEEGRD